MEYVHTHTIIVTINSSKVMYIHSAGPRHLNDDRSNSSICLLNIDIFQAKTCMDFYRSVFISKSRDVLVWDSLWSDLRFDCIWLITPTYIVCPTTCVMGQKMLILLMTCVIFTVHTILGLSWLTLANFANLIQMTFSCLMTWTTCLITF